MIFVSLGGAAEVGLGRVQGGGSKRCTQCDGGLDWCLDDTDWVGPGCPTRGSSTWLEPSLGVGWGYALLAQVELLSHCGPHSWILTAGKPQLLSLVPSLLTIRPFCTVASGSPPSLNAYSHPRSQCQLPLCSEGKRLGNFSSVGVLNSDVPSFKTSICYFSTLFN